MGVLYTVMPPSQEVADWLHELGIAVSVDTSSRGPNISEIRETLDSLEGFSVEYTDNGIGSTWQAMITSIGDPDSGGWTLLNISSRAEPGEPQEIWFEKGHPELIVEILSRLSMRCGTFVVIPDTGCPPLVISPGDDPKKLCAQWEHLNPNG
jgi:hypothetical protein